MAAKTSGRIRKALRPLKPETGIGALLNTSLNLHGKPIVRIAYDALHICPADSNSMRLKEEEA